MRFRTLNFYNILNKGETAFFGKIFKFDFKR